MIFGILLFSLMAHADYPPINKAFADKDYPLVIENILQDLKTALSSEERREDLRLIHLNPSVFYKIKDFDGSILQLSHEKCASGASADQMCNHYGDYEFETADIERLSVFSIARAGKEIVRLESRPRSRVREPDLRFGQVLQLMFNMKEKKSLYVFVGDGEKQKGFEKRLRRTIHIVRLDPESSCKIAEFDFTEKNDSYELGEELVRGMGSQLSCQDPPVVF